jgi:Rrf2 family nitric oxide-sensitive transcriptional repressor
MNLSLFTDYSLRVLMFAGVQSKASFSVNDVARAHRVSRHHMAKVVNFLAQRGYLSAKRGRGGGICLGRKPGEIRVGTVVRETEAGGIPLLECFDDATNTCPLIRACRLKGVLAEASQAFFKTLDQYTLDDLIQRPQPLKTALELTA